MARGLVKEPQYLVECNYTPNKNDPEVLLRPARDPQLDQRNSICF